MWLPTSGPTGVGNLLLPGTPFYSRVKAQLSDKTHWTDLGDLDMMFAGSYPREFYRVLHSIVHAEYRGMKTLRGKRWSRLPRLAIDAVKASVWRARLEGYLRKGPRSGAVGMS